jgi:tRNA(Ile)-lysidine synthase
MLIKALERSVTALGLAGSRGLVAVSGGIDSVVLMSALAELAPAHGLMLSVGHVHHGLRGAESDADEAFVRERAAALDLAFESERVAPGELREGRSNRERPTLQEAARSLRHAALRRMAERAGAELIVTAHNLDDQVETVLMRLFRGAGPDGLGGIAERSADGRVVRPLLAIPRADIEAFARERGLAWREDSSNASARYTRNRLRNEWLPALADAFNPQLLRAIGNLAEAQRRDSEWIEALVEQAAQAALIRRGETIELTHAG